MEADGAGSLRRPKLTGILVGLVGASLIALRQVVGRQHFSLEFPNGEMVTANVVVGDLLDGGSIGDWVLPEAPYILPDWFLALALEALSIPPGHTVWLTAALQVGALWWLWHTVIITVWPQQYWWRLLGGIVPITVLVVDRWPYQLALVGFWRFGTVLVVLTGIVLTLRVVVSPDGERPPPYRVVAMLGLGLMAFLGHLSDETIVVWYSLPMFAALAVYCYALRSIPTTVKVWTAVTVVGHLAATIIEPAIGQPIKGYQLSIGGLRVVPDRFGELVNLYLQWTFDSPVAMTLTTAGLVTAASGVYRSVFAGGTSATTNNAGVLWEHRHEPYELVLSSHLLFATVLAILAQLPIHLPIGFRYSLLIFFLPLMYVGGQIASWIGEAAQSIERRNTVIRFSAVLLGGLFVAHMVPNRAVPVALDRTPTEVRCVQDALEGKKLERGIASWVSQSALLFYTSGQFELVNYQDQGGTGPLTVSLKVHNTAWVGRSYDFAVVDTFNYGTPTPWLSAAGVMSVAGEPQAMHDCGRWQVMIYQPGGIPVT